MLDPDALQAIARSDRYADTRELIRELDLVLEVLGEADRAEVCAARDLSLSAHFKQKNRPDGQPYVNHPLQVTLNVARKFNLFTCDALIAALLHDSVEDQPDRIVSLLGGSPDEVGNNESEAFRLIGEQFGGRVSEIVGRLTNPNFNEMVNQSQMEGDSRSDDELFIEFYKEHFLEIMDKDPEAFLIKLADFSENAFKIENVDDSQKKDW